MAQHRSICRVAQLSNPSRRLKPRTTPRGRGAATLFTTLAKEAGVARTAPGTPSDLGECVELARLELATPCLQTLWTGPPDLHFPR
jgi:hypothetical protein